MPLRRWALGLACPVFATLMASAAMSQTSFETEALILRSGLVEVSRTRQDLTVTGLKRYAIVVGNGAYEHAADLRNSEADAKLVAAFLRDQGYQTHEYRNATKLNFEEILRAALFNVDKDTEVVFYFAGHGLQIGSKNYIVPVDASLSTAYDVPFETVSLQSLVSIIGARARSQVLVLDSCRDNPFGAKKVYTDIDKTPRQSRTGFSAQTAPVNSLLAFSTSPGGVAFDGEGKNSPYTAAFVEIASKNPGKTIGGVLEEVRKALYEQTYGFQISWESSTLVKPLYFDPGTVFEATSNAKQPFSENTSTRTMALLASSLPQSAASPYDEKPNYALEAALEEEVEIGSALSDGISTLAPVKLLVPPELGQLAVSQDNNLQMPVGSNPLSARDLSRIIYVTNGQQQPATAMENQLVADRFEVAVGDVETIVKVTLKPDLCDFEAGDYLDPDGVGLARYPNEIEPHKALVACEASLAANPENGRFHYQLGRAHLALRDFDAAREAFGRARDLGHARAWHALGNLIATSATATGGRKNEQAPEQALAHYALGVKAGDPYAYYALGRELMRYESDIDRQREGFELMLRSLEVGHTFAMNELGYFYLDENSDFYDPERGLRYLRESAARNDIYGYNNLGIVYQNGLGGVQPNAETAASWYIKAAKGGHPNAPTNLGRMYYNGQIGGSSDPAKAIEWYDQGLERGDAWAGTNAAWIIVNKKVEGYSKFDAAVRAGQAAALRNREAAAAAEKLLRGMSKKHLNGGAQMLLNALGEDLTVDGAFGAGSKSALARVAENASLQAPKNPVQRLKFLAALYWQNSKFRVDLY
ncbi:MAG: hypothetical protein GY952_02995 [Rhodobacteraceae bacterium]|nr:hypothetical protein [Paracoccaceae bacterium]